MARVICTLPHCSTSVNGIAFTESKGEMVSEEVSDAVAENFALIEGFRIAGAKKPAPTKTTPADGAPAAS